MNEDHVDDHVPDKVFSLNYLDKVYAVLTATERRISRLLTIQVVISIAIILLSLGVISISPEVSMAGLKIRVETPELIVAGACINGFVFAYYVILIATLGEIGGRIRFIYDVFGFKGGSHLSALGAIIPRSALWYLTKGPYRWSFVNAMAVIVLLLLPILAEVLATVHLALLKRWMSGLLVVPWVTVIWSLICFFRGKFSEAENLSWKRLGSKY